MSIADAAERLDCTPRTIRRYISTGTLRGYRVGPRLIRVDLAELDALLCPIPTAGGHDAGLASLTGAAQRDRLAARLRGGHGG